jgi:LacI family transcriptional regulator
MRDERGAGSRPATIQDVARVAGVSVGTASKALNGTGKLRAETVARVRAAAAQLEYRPNALMQSVLRRRSHTVGLVTTASGRFSMPLLMGVEDALSAERMSVFLCPAPYHSPERERQHIESLLAKHVDGIIVLGWRTDPRPPIEVGRTRTPVLYAYTYIDRPDTLCLLPDDAQGGRQATAHLLEAGRRRQAHISGPADWGAVRLRRDAMREVLGEHGLALPDDLVLLGPWSQRWGYEATGRLLEADPRIDGLFCGNDQIAVGAIDALRESGRRIPDDVAVVGFDNWIEFAEETRPPLTTVDMQIYELGRRAGLRMLGMMRGERESGIVRLPCRLVVRASSVPTTAGERPAALDDTLHRPGIGGRA